MRSTVKEDLRIGISSRDGVGLEVVVILVAVLVTPGWFPPVGPDASPSGGGGERCESVGAGNSRSIGDGCGRRVRATPAATVGGQFTAADVSERLAGDAGAIGRSIWASRTGGTERLVRAKAVDIAVEGDRAVAVRGRD